jgi:hypothetical protein
MADALASGASVLRDVGVQVPLRPPQRFYGLPAFRSRTVRGVVAFVFRAAALMHQNGAATIGGLHTHAGQIPHDHVGVHQFRRIVLNNRDF